MQMTLQEALRVIPRQRRRIDSYKPLIRFLNGEMGVSLMINSQKSKNHGKFTTANISENILQQISMSAMMENTPNEIFSLKPEQMRC